MHFALANGQAEMVKTLAQLGANIDKQENDGVTPLLLASFKGRTLVVVALLALGADRSIASTQAFADIPGGSTPLSIAQAKGHADIVRNDGGLELAVERLDVRFLLPTLRLLRALGRHGAVCC